MAGIRTIGFIFVPGFADWEYGMLAAGAVDWFGLRTVALSPDGQPVASMAGFKLTPDRAITADNTDLDGVAVVGSDAWAGSAPPDVSVLIKAVAARGGVVGGICGGTLALARAGLFAGKSHTSNGRDWLGERAPGYAGQDRYSDVAHAVADGNIISAAGSAPGSFALSFLAALMPEQKGEALAAMFRREYGVFS